MLEFIDTCHLIGGRFKSCALITDKDLRKVPAGSSEVGSTGTCKDLQEQLAAARKLSEVSVKAAGEAGGSVITDRSPPGKDSLSL